MKRILLIIILAVSPFCHGADLTWFAAEQSKRTDSESSKSSDDFAGMLMVTSDTDWEEKWLAPGSGLPQFTQADSVGYGEELAILTFFMNPMPDKDNKVDVECNMMVSRPNRTIAVFQHGVTCMEGVIEGSPGNVRVSPAVLKFTGEPGDPAGTWVIDVEIRDMNRKTTLKLKTRFNLVARGD